MQWIASHRLMRSGFGGVVLTSWIFLGCILFAQPAEALSLRINAPRIELELAPGESYSGELNLENADTEEVSVKLYLEDWRYQPGGAGDKEFLPPNSTPLSAAGWITYTPANVVIAPLAKQIVRYTITVPADASGGYYAVLFMETAMGQAQDEEGASVLVAGRIGSIFLVNVKGTVRKEGQIKGVEVIAPEGNKPLEIQTTFENTGNTAIELNGTFILMDAEGSAVARGSLQTLHTFPQSTETRATQWSGSIAKGTYDLLLTYDLGQGQTLVEEKQITIA